MFFLEMVILTAMGILGVRWAMRGAYEMGHDEFAYGPTDIFTFFNLAIYEMIASTGIFCGIFLANSTIDIAAGVPIVLTTANKHLVSDGLFASLVAQILIWAMIIEGIRIRKRYYQFVAPLRKLYLSIPKTRLVRPPFSQLYRLW